MRTKTYIDLKKVEERMREIDVTWAEIKSRLKIGHVAKSHLKVYGELPIKDLGKDHVLEMLQEMLNIPREDLIAPSENTAA